MSAPVVTRGFSPRANYGGLNYGAHAPAAGQHRDHGRYRGVYVSPWGYGYGAGPVLGWYPGYLGYPDDFGDDDSQDAGQNYLANGPDVGDGYDAPDGGPIVPYPNGSSPDGYGPLAPAPGPPAPRMPYRPSAQPQLSDAPQSQASVTLIFKDGRPAEQIHNYLLTPTTIYAGRRDIAIDEIDIAATEKANRDAGVDFELPNAANQ